MHKDLKVGSLSGNKEVSIYIVKDNDYQLAV